MRAQTNLCHHHHRHPVGQLQRRPAGRRGIPAGESRQAGVRAGQPFHRPGAAPAGQNICVRWLAEGKEFDEICEEMLRYHKHTHLLFSLESLANLARNGRGSLLLLLWRGCWASGSSDRQVRPGELDVLCKTRGEHGALERIVLELSAKSSALRYTNSIKNRRGRQGRIPHVQIALSSKFFNRIFNRVTIARCWWLYRCSGCSGRSGPSRRGGSG